MPRKPEPLMVGDKAYYTLESYDPVEVEVSIPYTTDDDVEYAIAVMCQTQGGSVENLSDPDWLREKFDVDDLPTLHDMVRGFVTDSNTRAAEQDKMSRCAEELAKRLNQSVPLRYVSEVEQEVRASFDRELAANGLTVEQFLERTGTRRSDLDDMFRRQATEAAEQEAALDAFAEKRRVQVADEELPELLGMPADQARQLADDARRAGHYEDVVDAARRNKALRIVVDECSCTYHHETPDEAAERVRQVKTLQQELVATRGAAAQGEGPRLVTDRDDVPRDGTSRDHAPAPDEGDGDGRPHLRLV